MDANQVSMLLSKLSKETIALKINWRCLIELESVKPESNTGLHFTIFQTEFHHVDLYDSYYTIVPNGTIYLINETHESGRDGTITQGYNLYLQEEDSTEMLHVPTEQKLLYQLSNSIKSCFPDPIINDMKISKFIDSFLNS